jgi:hypothetical protein
MKKYTHRSKDGMMWRFEGSRPISALADFVMKDLQRAAKPSKRRKQKKK